MLYAWEHDVPSAEAGPTVGLTAEQVERVYRDIVAKRRAAERGLRDALLVEPVHVAAPAPGTSLAHGVGAEEERQS